MPYDYLSRIRGATPDAFEIFGTPKSVGLRSGSFTKVILWEIRVSAGE